MMTAVKKVLATMWRSISHTSPVYCDYEGPMALSDLELSRIGITRYEAAMDRCRRRMQTRDASGNVGQMQRRRRIIIESRWPDL